jgi:hypothetical protein
VPNISWNLLTLKYHSLSQAQWLTPVILATQETEIRRIQPEANSSQNPVSKKPI